MGLPVINTTRLTAAGNIKASAGHLFWVLCATDKNDPTQFVFHNATSGTNNEVFRVIVPADSSILLNFSQPIFFSTGIRMGSVSESAIFVTGGYK